MTDVPLPSRDFLMRLAGYPKPGDPGYIGTAYGQTMIWNDDVPTEYRPVPDDPWARFTDLYPRPPKTGPKANTYRDLTMFMTRVVLHLTEDDWM